MSKRSYTHHLWPPLPQFPDYPYKITENDLEFFGDVMLMRGFTNLIEDTCTTNGAALQDIPHDWSWELHVTIAQSQANWPHDHADTLLATWRRERAISPSPEVVT